MVSPVHLLPAVALRQGNTALRPDSLRQKPGGSLPPAVGGCYPPPSSLVVCSTGRVLLPSLTSLSHLHRTCDTISTRALLGGVAKRAALARADLPPALPCATLTHHTQAVAQSPIHLT